MGIFSELQTRLCQLLRRETHALPIDIFRVLVGLLSLAYFIRTYLEIEDFSSSDGLIDHELLFDLFWYLRVGIFQPGLPDAFFRVIFLLACAASVTLLLGVRPKISAAFLYVVAVSTYRWNFLVMYVDDAIQHILYLWMLLLPIGRTLTLSSWLREGSGAWKRWKSEVVPGGAVVCFVGNISLLYLIAGLWKHESAMWQDGTAVYAILKLPVAYMPDFWRPEHLSWLVPCSDMALFIEPVIPLLFLLRSGHVLRWIGLPFIIGFHLFILLTLRVPFANIACIAACAITYRGELMALLCRRSEAPPLDYRVRVGRSGRLAFVLLVLLCTAMMRRLPYVGKVHMPAYGLLYLIGVAQDYQLFNWIHKKNFYVQLETYVEEEGRKRRPLNSSDIFPGSIRHVLLQSYLHNIRWIKIPRGRVTDLKLSLYRRFARRYCRLDGASAGIVTVNSTVQRVTGDNLAVDRGILRRIMRFQCAEPEPRMLFMTFNLLPPRNRPIRNVHRRPRGVRRGER